MNDKIIGGTVVGILSIAGVAVSVTDEDIAEQYRENTGKELSINQADLVSYDEIIEGYQAFKLDIQDLSNTIDCVNYEYDFSASCESVDLLLKDYLKSTDKSISCFDRINTNSNIEESDLTYCVEAMQEEKSIIKDFYVKTEGYCNSDCDAELVSPDYNLAAFQSYLENIR